MRIDNGTVFVYSVFSVLVITSVLLSFASSAFIPFLANAELRVKREAKGEANNF